MVPIPVGIAEQLRFKKTKGDIMEHVIGERIVASTIGSYTPKYHRLVIVADKAYGSRQVAGISLEVRSISYRECDGVRYAMDYGIEEVLDRESFGKLLRSNSKELKERFAECVERWTMTYSYRIER